MCVWGGGRGERGEGGSVRSLMVCRERGEKRQRSATVYNRKHLATK